MLVFSYKLSFGNECPGENEEYEECGTACPLTCENHANPPPCTLQCVPGCQCEKGYVRKSESCVKPEEC